MPAALLLKLLPYLIVLVIVGAFADYMFETGKKVERSAWQEREIKIQTRSSQLLAQAQLENEQIRQHHQVKIAEAVNVKEQENNQLRTRVNDLHAHGLYVSAKCQGNSNAMSRKASDTKELDGVTSRVRLSEQDEQNLIAIAEDAQKVVIQYNALLKVCSPLVTTN